MAVQWGYVPGEIIDEDPDAVDNGVSEAMDRAAESFGGMVVAAVAVVSAMLTVAGLIVYGVMRAMGGL